MNEQALKDALVRVLTTLVAEARAEAPQGPVCQRWLPDPIPVELSARHVHLSEEDAMALFGHPLTPVRELSQPGQFLCKERVRLIGPKNVMDNVAILGPARKATQVEVSATDARALGVKAPVRQSGDTAGSPGIILASDTGIVGIASGVIVAARHIHMAPSDAEHYGLVDKDRVCVRLGTERPLVLEDVLVRVNKDFRLAMHIDADEGNGAGWHKGVTGIILGKSGDGHGLCVSQ